MVNDSDFQDFAKDFEKEEAQKRERRGGSFAGGNYTEIKWTGLEPNKMKVVRVLGGVPNSANSDNFTARTAQVAWIRGDDGKNFRCVLPPKDENPEHLMWRVIERVNEVTWINKKRIPVNETKHPEIYNLVNSNGLPDSDQRKKYDRGWTGRNVIVMNVIDREQMDWHRENKHTMLLSRNIGVSADGSREYPEEGVPVYGFFNVIATNLFKHYGNWENYDIGIVRLGTTQTPYQLINASVYAKNNLPELPSSMKPYVSLEPLTEEEAGWARYDLKKMYSPSTFTKIYNHLQVAFRTIDAKLGTKFFQELEYEMEQEKKAREAQQAEQASSTSEQYEKEAAAQTVISTPQTPSAPVKASVTEAAPARTRVSKPVATNGLSAEDIALLKGWSKLSPAQQAEITSIEKNAKGVLTNINFSTSDALLRCPTCNMPGPETYTACPGCGTEF